MNAATRQAFRRHLVACAAAVGCSIACALPPELMEIASLNSAQLRTAYLECDRLSSQSILAPDEMAVCAAVGDVLLQRDFGGVFERQLQWWRGARSAFVAPAAGSVSISGSVEP
jgi:hypothetical protein